MSTVPATQLQASSTSLTFSTPTLISGTSQATAFSPNGAAINNNGDIVVAFSCEQGLFAVLGQCYAVGNITWQTPFSYDVGLVPSISVNDAGVVVEIHETNSWDSDRLWYNMGAVTGNSLTFPNGSKQASPAGSVPAIAINNLGYFVEVHQTNGAGTALWWYTGTIDVPNGTLRFSNGLQFDNGSNPSIAFIDDNNFFSTHWNGVSELYCNIGSASPPSYELNVYDNPTYNYSAGTYPSIAVASDGSSAVEAHVTNAVDSFTLYYSVDSIANGAVIFGPSTAESANGSMVAIASSEKLVVQISFISSPNPNFNGLWASVSPVANS
jgi:hypothetical protein